MLNQQASLGSRQVIKQKGYSHTGLRGVATQGCIEWPHRVWEVAMYQGWKEEVGVLEQAEIDRALEALALQFRAG